MKSPKFEKLDSLFPILVLAVGASWLSSCGCNPGKSGSEKVVLVSHLSREPEPDPSITVVGSPAYLRRAATFKVSLDEADGLREAAVKQNLDWPTPAYFCWLMDGDWFVYSAPPSKDGIELHGAYVNAFTGEVKWESDYGGVVRWDSNRELFKYAEELHARTGR